MQLRQIEAWPLRLAATGLVDEIALIPHTQDPAQRERIVHLVGEMIPSLV